MKRFRFYKKILSYLGKYKWLVLVAFLFRIVPSITVTTNDFFLGKIVDSVSLNDSEATKLFLAAFIGMVALKSFFQRAGNFFSERKIYSQMPNFVVRQSLEKSFNLSLGQLRQEHSGFKQDVLTKGSMSIGNLYHMIIDESFPIFATIVSSVIGLFLINPRVSYIAVIFFIIYYGLATIINSKIHLPMKEIIKRRIISNTSFLEILKNIFWLKFSNQLKNTLSHLRGIQLEQEKKEIKLWTKYNFQHIASDIVLILYFGISIYYTILLVTNGSISIGMLIPTMSWTFTLASSIGEYRMYQRRIMIAESDVEKMFEMLDQKSDVVISDNPVAIKTLNESVKFENVTFGYSEGKKEALTNICFEIKKGEKVALVGRSGSGKTTIVSLLLRLYDPNSGLIKIDGVDLKKIDLSSWHKVIGYVSQEGDIMDVTIRENILFGANHEVTDSEIEHVLERAGIKEFINNLPDGINTKVGENGVKLSGGQRQRVCIARALIKNSAILVLDEATSSLDSETEHVVNKAIWEMLDSKTGVVIAHRLSTILDADKIIVMDHGEVIGIGSHEELLKTTPYYKKLVDAQNISL